MTVFDADAAVRVTLSGKGGLGNLTLPVDFAVSAEGMVAVVSAGLDMVVETSFSGTTTGDALENCAGSAESRTIYVRQPIAAAYGAEGRLLVQGRGSLLFVINADGQVEGEVPYPTARRLHLGHLLFHRAPGGINAPVACASCHPESRDDGRVWRFQGLGPRRTQSVLGGVLDTAPLHWDGDMDGLEKLMGEVFVNRMGGVQPDPYSLAAVADYVQSLPALPPSAALDDAVAARGEELFHDATVGCAGCHTGASLTNDQTVDVGTGKAFQVPSLVGIADRAPFMHDGCAETLHDRFDPICGGGDVHGKTSHLPPEDIDALVAYLETL
jgi:mono/diheme cytochrome c family protein